MSIFPKNGLVTCIGVGLHSPLPSRSTSQKELKLVGAQGQSHVCPDGGRSLDFAAGMGHKSC